MSYVFNPIADEDLDNVDLINEGQYDFEVLKSERKTSKSGNPMAALTLLINDGSTSRKIIFDYLVFSEVKLCMKKVSHFCKSVGLQEEYKKGFLPEELERYCGKVDIAIENEMPKPSGGFYPKKNVVVDYVGTSSETTKVKAEAVKDDFEDDVPF